MHHQSASAYLTYIMMTTEIKYIYFVVENPNHGIYVLQMILTKKKSHKYLEECDAEKEAKKMRFTLTKDAHIENDI